MDILNVLRGLSIRSVPLSDIGDGSAKISHPKFKHPLPLKATSTFASRIRRSCRASGKRREQCSGVCVELNSTPLLNGNSDGKPWDADRSSLTASPIPRVKTLNSSSTASIHSMNCDSDDLIHSKRMIRYSSVPLYDTSCEYYQEREDTEYSNFNEDMYMDPNQDLSGVRRLISLDAGIDDKTLITDMSMCCPCCKSPFDRSKKRKLVDSCGHERCYTCMFRFKTCFICKIEFESQLGQGLTPAKLNKCDQKSVSKENDIQQYSRSSVISYPPNSHISTNKSHSSLCANGNVAIKSRDGPRIRRFMGPGSPSSCLLRRSLIGASSSSVIQKKQKHFPLMSNVNQAISLSQPSSKKYAFPFVSKLGGGGQEATAIRRSGSAEPPSSQSHESGFQGSMTSSLNSIEDSTNNCVVSSRPGDEKMSLSSSPVLSNDSLFSATKTSSTCKVNSSLKNCGFQRPVLCSSVKPNSLSPLPVSDFRPTIWTLKPLFFEVPSFESNPIFIGRQWLYREISDNLTSDLPTNRGVIITGGPGSGKTAIILQLVKHSCFGSIDTNEAAIRALESVTEELRYTNQRFFDDANAFDGSLKCLASQVVSYHFCQADNATTCLVPEFVHSLAAQLSQSPQLKPYYDIIASDIELQDRLSLSGCVADPDEALLKGILQPLLCINIGGLTDCFRCLIVIDGLCEAELHRPDHGDTIGSFVAKHLQSFPEWLKIVVSVRSKVQVITKALPFQKICLDKTDVDERLNKDMLDYIVYRIERSSSIRDNITPFNNTKLEGTPQSRLCAFLSKSAHGCFLYTKMVLDLIERGHLVIKSSGFNVLPLTLAEIFMLEFNLKFPTVASFERIRYILCTALASLTPLTTLELFNAVNSLKQSEVENNENPDDEQLNWGEFLMLFSSLSPSFLIRRLNNTVMFFHPVFREWLIRRSNNESSKFVCDPRIGHAAIVYHLSQNCVPLGPDRTLEMGHHILKAHLYKTMLRNLRGSPVDPWINLVMENASLALGAVRNIAAPNIKVSRLLLLAGASPNHCTDYLNEARLLAVFSQRGLESMVSLLIEFGADVNAGNASGISPLMFGASQGHIEIVRSLIQHGACINATDRTEACALVYASRNGHTDVVSYLVACDWISTEGHDLELAEAAQQSMVAAAMNGHVVCLEFLLDMSEVSIDASDTLEGCTALCAAASQGQAACVEVLIRRGADIKTPNLKEIPPLHHAVAHGHWAVTDVLLREGADIEQVDGQGRSALIIAALEGHLGVLELLLQRKADLNRVDREGLTALAWACLKGRIQTATCLLDRGCDIEKMDKNGRSPLDLAAYKGNPQVIQLLLDRAANVEHVDFNGMRPLDRAISCRNSQAVQCFLKKGAKLGPATWSMVQGKPEILLILLNKLLEDGNTLYRKGSYNEAAHRYNYALRRLPPAPPDASPSPGMVTFVQLRVHITLNLSRCYRKLCNYDEAINLASEIVSIQPDLAEALHARAKAKQEAGQLAEAISDLSEALRVSPQNRESHKLILKLKEELENSKMVDDLP